jgi:GR25 family glycosyltransferase involved in LPS biosynthesis
MRINVISLERTPDRLDEFRRLNAHLKHVSVFKAPHHPTLSQDELAARGLIVLPIHYTGGALGSMMSHMALWEHAATSGEITTVCEDDAIFSLAFERRALELIAVLPDDTDVIYWGWNFDAQAAIELIPGLPPWVTAFGRNPLPSEIEPFQNCPISSVPIRLLRAFGIICYTVTPKGARRLRELCLPVRGETWEFPEIKLRSANVGIDVGMCNALPRIRGYCAFPPLVMSLDQPHKAPNAQRRGPCNKVSTLIFCTSYFEDQKVWEGRYRRWLNYYADIFQNDLLFMIDDGSPYLPQDCDVRINEGLETIAIGEKATIFRFPDRLGRPSILNYPGWFRSFTFSVAIAKRLQVRKIVHVESDLYILSRRAVEFIKAATGGWTVFWSPKWGFPETALQIICEDSFDALEQLRTIPYKTRYVGKRIEELLPYSYIEKRIYGDRFSEYGSNIPRDADFAAQVNEDTVFSSQFY